jgi:hypothetical protein
LTTYTDRGIALPCWSSIRLALPATTWQRMSCPSFVACNRLADLMHGAGLKSKHKMQSSNHKALFGVKTPPDRQLGIISMSNCHPSLSDAASARISQSIGHGGSLQPQSYLRLGGSRRRIFCLRPDLSGRLIDGGHWDWVPRTGGQPIRRGKVDETKL